MEEVGDGLDVQAAVAQLAADVEGRVTRNPVAGAVAAHQTGNLAEVLGRDAEGYKLQWST